MTKLALLLVAAIVLSGCQTVLVSHREAVLEDAGFKATPADTPERQALLSGLPARRITARPYDLYVYADPLVCDCLYIGSQEAYAKYLALTSVRRNAIGLPASTNNVTNNSPPMPGFGYVGPAHR